MGRVLIAGGGLAGSEAACQLAEMKPSILRCGVQQHAGRSRRFSRMPWLLNFAVTRVVSIALNGLKRNRLTKGSADRRFFGLRLFLGNSQFFTRQSRSQASRIGTA